MASRNQVRTVIASGVACAGALAFVLWSLRADGSASAHPAAEPPSPPQPAVEALGPGASADEARSPLAEEAPEPAPAPAAEVAAELAGPALALEKLRPRLLDSLEASLLGSVEPEVFLDAALELVKLEIDPVANPEPSPNGALRFEVLGTPPGMSAELSVGRARNPEWDVVITMTLSVDPARAPYIVDGRSRETPEARVTVWRGLDGSVKHCTVSTTLIPDGRISASGLPVDVGEVPFGALYSMNVDDPSKNVVKLDGMRDGSTAGDLSLPAELVAEPPLSKVQELSSGLVSQYGQAKKK